MEHPTTLLANSAEVMRLIFSTSEVPGDAATSEFQERIRQMQRLEGLGLLAGAIANNCHNLINGVLANLRLALDALQGDNSTRAGLSDVVRDTERASALARRIATYAGRERCVVEPVNLSEVVKEIAPVIESLLPRCVNVLWKLHPELPFIESDAGQLQQVVMNLVINGAEAIGEKGGTVIVRTGKQEADELYLRTMLTGLPLATGWYATLDVDDSGCGMDEMTQTKIFDPFFTTKLTGRGLGLAAVAGIVRAHRGALKVHSAPGQGSTFKIIFPIRPETAPSLPREKAAASLQGSGRVLIADDEELIRTYATAALEHFGYTVTTARDGQEAVDLFARDPSAFDLIFLDLTMPVMNGQEAVRRLLALRPGIPVILSSGLNEALAVRHFAGDSLAGFIQKPYSTRSLGEKIKAILSPRGH